MRAIRESMFAAVTLAMGALAASIAGASSRASGDFFGLTSKDGRDWFSRPDGRRFWSFGVDCVGPGETPQEYSAANPGYAAFRLGKSPHDWTVETLDQLRAWGFNSLGGWSDVDYMRKNGGAVHVPYFEVLHLGSYARAPFADIFAPDARKAMSDAAHKLMPPLRNDPDLAGYFSDNELGWWGDTLFITYLGMPSGAPGKRRMMAVIRQHYHDDFASLTRDWNTDATSFDRLDRLGKMTLRPGGRGMDLVNDWLREMGTYYYSFMHELIRAEDPNHLILGDRYCQFYEMPIVEAAKPYVDVISTNFGATWNDGAFAHFFLDTLHQVTGRPVIVTEFYMGATENRSGNRNTPPAFPVVKTQAERAAAFERNVEGLAALPYVIGAHWFQFYDEPPKGRGDGENFNHGLVDIYGKPYEGMIAAARAAVPEERHAVGVEPAPAAIVPPAPDDPMGDLKGWPRTRGWIAPTSGVCLADLYVCRDAHDLYFSILPMEFTDEHLYEGDRIPDRERSQWTIELDGRRFINVRFGGKGQRASVSASGVEVSEGDGLMHRVTVKIPYAFAGPTVRIACGVATHSRGYRCAYKTVLRTAP